MTNATCKYCGYQHTRETDVVCEVPVKVSEWPLNYEYSKQEYPALEIDIRLTDSDSDLKDKAQIHLVKKALGDERKRNINSEARSTKKRTRTVDDAKREAEPSKINESIHDGGSLTSIKRDDPEYYQKYTGTIYKVKN